VVARSLGVRRVSAGSVIAPAAYGMAQRAATQLLTDGRYQAMLETIADYAGLNALYAGPRGT
jgi:2-methylisocitrate lyase-like PEP mutase family enzyme